MHYISKLYLWYLCKFDVSDNLWLEKNGNTLKQYYKELQIIKINLPLNFYEQMSRVHRIGVGFSSFPIFGCFLENSLLAPKFGWKFALAPINFRRPWSLCVRVVSSIISIWKLTGRFFQSFLFESPHRWRQTNFSPL